MQGNPINLEFFKNNELGHYTNGNYEVIILKDGTKIRVQEDNNAPFIPSFPESMDITITEKCKVGCSYCYANCTTNGNHADLFKYNFINDIKPFTEVAINGNDLDHPQLADFLKFMKKKQVIVNITVNQKQFMEHQGQLYYWQKDELIHGIGVSYVKPEFRFLDLVSGPDFKNIVIHTIAGILSQSDINYLSQKGDKINLLILGYKTKGRGVGFKQDYSEEIQERIRLLEANYQHLINTFRCVSFDNLALEQLHIKDKLTKEQWEDYYMGDEGSVTFFIDMVNGRFARSSMDIESFEITPEMDSVDKMFNFIRNKYDGKIDGENKI